LLKILFSKFSYCEVRPMFSDLFRDQKSKQKIVLKYFFSETILTMAL
jgi:hypothetical protein